MEDECEDEERDEALMSLVNTISSRQNEEHTRKVKEQAEQVSPT
jgi:hypothetical protein